MKMLLKILKKKGDRKMVSDDIKLKPRQGSWCGFLCIFRYRFNPDLFLQA